MTNIQAYTSLKAPAQVAQIIELRDLSQLHGLSLKEFIVLGDGTNVLFVDDYEGVVIVNQLKGIGISKREDYTVVTAQAGENWHDFVCAMSKKGLHGLENLALIPGTVGASPVQNIGAYGVEVADFIEAVSAYDVKTKERCSFTKEECEFGYRDSIFKQTVFRQRYIITSVSFRLSEVFSPNISYNELSQRFIDKQKLTASELLNAVIDIRQSKLPDYRLMPNAGSFFKNPVVDVSQFEKLTQIHVDIPYFSVQDGIKIPAAWLIQSAGLKGIRHNGAGIYEKHALILINPEHSSGKNVAELAQHVIDKVYQQFGIMLEPEVRFIP